MVIELLIILALVLANGLFAGAEIAILAVGKPRLRDAVHRRVGGAAAVKALRENPERFLATVQVGITVIGATAAAFGGASLARRIAPMLEDAGLSVRAAQDVAIAAVVVLVAFLSLVLGELVPKSLALRYSDRYAFYAGRPLLWIARAARPIVWFLTATSNLVLRLFGDRTSFTESRVSRDELRELVEEAAHTGSLPRSASEIASRALTFGDVIVAELAVPRERIVAIPRGVSMDELRRVLLEEGHTRLPVHDGDLDRIVGYVVARDLLAVAWGDGLIVLDDIIRPRYAVPASARAHDVLREMQARRVHMAIVEDDTGGTIGLVTVEDLVEELVGEIIDEHEEPEELVRGEQSGSVLVPGWAPVRKVNRALDIDLPTGRDSVTIAGLCLALALAVPSIGTKIAAGGTVLEIVDASARRVRLVRIHRDPPTSDR